MADDELVGKVVELTFNPAHMLESITVTGIFSRNHPFVIFLDHVLEDETDSKLFRKIYSFNGHYFKKTVSGLHDAGIDPKEYLADIMKAYADGNNNQQGIGFPSTGPDGEYDYKKILGFKRIAGQK